MDRGARRDLPHQAHRRRQVAHQGRGAAQATRRVRGDRSGASRLLLKNIQAKGTRANGTGTQGARDPSGGAVTKGMRGYQIETRALPSWHARLPKSCRAWRGWSEYMGLGAQCPARARVCRPT